MYQDFLQSECLWKYPGVPPNNNVCACIWWSNVVAWRNNRSVLTLEFIIFFLAQVQHLCVSTSLYTTRPFSFPYSLFRLSYISPSCILPSSNSFLMYFPQSCFFPLYILMIFFFYSIFSNTISFHTTSAHLTYCIFLRVHISKLARYIQWNMNPLHTCYATCIVL